MTFNLYTKRTISLHKFLPIFTIAALLAIYVNGLIRLDDLAHLGMSALYFLAIVKLILEKRQTLSLQTTFASMGIGFLIIGITIWQAILSSQSELFWRIMPLLSAFGLTLVISQFQSLQYWRELLILAFLGIPKLTIAAFYDPSPITAKVAGNTLWYLGFESRVFDDVYVMLPNGGVKVFEGCSGLESMCYTLGLAVICLLLYPVSRQILNWIVPLVAIAIGFLVNVGRVSLLALLNAWQYKSAFIYWHEGDGSLIFGMLAVITFTIFYYFLPQKIEFTVESSH